MGLSPAYLLGVVRDGVRLRKSLDQKPTEVFMDRATWKVLVPSLDLQEKVEGLRVIVNESFREPVVR